MNTLAGPYDPDPPSGGSRFEKDPEECGHENIVDNSTGSRWNTRLGPTDDIEEGKICLDCGATDEELI